MQKVPPPSGRTLGALSVSTIDALVDEALKITGNMEESEEDDNARARNASSAPPKWRPAGRIRVWDDSFGSTRLPRRVLYHWEYYDCADESLPLQIRYLEEFYDPEECRRPVYRTEYITATGSYVTFKGIEVRARRWFTTHKGKTNSEGRYSCDGRFRRRANYSIRWERYQFQIRDGWGWFSCAKDNGPKKRGDWNESYRSGKHKYYATIFRAAHHYYYRNIKGLRRPPQNSFWRTQVKLRAYNESNDKLNGNHSAGRRFLGLGSAIRIYNPQNESDEIYSTVIHELAHASHWNMDRSAYRDAESIVKESWARGVQWELTRMVYPSYRGGATIRPNYTQVVVDMIDRSGDNNAGSEDLSEDNVSSYTIRQLEDALKGKELWDSWKNNIKQKYNNGTENNLDALFAYWN